MKNKNSMYYDVIVIGGGAAGLFCGAQIKKERPDISVAILESQDRVGKKLLVTGNGRCNLTNMGITKDRYHGSFRHCAEELLHKCPPQKIIELFEDLGLLTTIDRDSRVYPLSRQANSVLDILRNANSNFGTEIITNSKVTNIKKQKGIYNVICKDKQYLGKKIVVATGSKASPSTGADVSIFDTIEGLGHSITELTPSLCPVTVKSPYIKSLKGVRANAKVSILKNNKVIKSEFGEVQFTENSLSGICVFNLSRIANTQNNTEISVSLLPDKSTEEILKILKHKVQIGGANSKADELFVGLFNKMIGLCLIKEAGINQQINLREVKISELEKLAEKINDLRFTVVPHRSFDRSQVTAGGISGKEINPETMESKILKNLYIIGEAADCDGDCGGMNLYFAFSSAYTAAEDIIKL